MVQIAKYSFLDLQNAFDNIEHHILLRKIEKTGIRRKTLQWLKSYFQDRFQRTVLNGMTSSWSKISCGVPQKSILGPLLLLIYINNMPLSCDRLDVLLFADDTNLTAMGKLDVQVENDPKRLNQWLISNKLVLKIDKTSQLNIKTSVSLSRFQFNSSNVKVELVCKYL